VFVNQLGLSVNVQEYGVAVVVQYLSNYAVSSRQKNCNLRALFLVPVQKLVLNARLSLFGNITNLLTCLNYNT